MTTSTKDPLETLDDLPGDLTGEIVIDESPTNPRGEATLGKISAKSKRYADDTAISADSEREFYLRLACKDDPDFQMEVEEAQYEHVGLGVGMYEYVGQYPDELEEKAREIVYDKYLVLNLYIYKHGQEALSTGPFQSLWDSGKGGQIYIGRETLEEKCPEDRENEVWAREIVETDLDRFQSYLNGAAYGFVIRGSTGERVDSCYGFYDRDYCKEEARRVAERWADKS